jgi:hypothetical protein
VLPGLLSQFVPMAQGVRVVQTPPLQTTGCCNACPSHASWPAEVHGHPVTPMPPSSSAQVSGIASVPVVPSSLVVPPWSAVASRDDPPSAEPAVKSAIPSTALHAAEAPTSPVQTEATTATRPFFMLKFA